MIGKLLGHYRILDRLGAGGMGEVWLAEDTDLGRRVAIKTLRSDVAATPAQQARLEREARAVAALNHPNIVTLFSVGEAEGTRFLVMEYVEGQRLTDRIPSSGLPPREALRIGAAVADALATAHAQGIVHRDLKPGNVLLTADGRVKVVDFGLARAYSEGDSPFTRLARDTSLTQEGLAVGTLHYMSPEQLEGAALDHRADLYSLGVLLHEMVTGELPFAAESAVRVISAILRDRPERVDVGSPHLPPAIGDLIERLLAKNPDDRPDSGAEVRDLLLDAQRLLGSATTVINAPLRLSRSGSRRRARAWKRGLMIAAAIVLPLAGLALALGRWRPAGAAHPPVAAPSPAIAVLPLANYSGDSDYFVDGMTDGLIGALARINGLRVISRQSVMHYKGSAKRLPEIAQELGVDYVVEASLRRESGRLRVQAKLFRPDPEEQVWSDAFDRPDPEVLALHAEVARSIAGAVHVATPSALATAPTVDPAVYEAFLRGRQLAEQLRPDSLRRAKDYFDEALRRDPRFAPAHAGLARVYGLLAYLFEEPTANAARQQAEARRAIELQEDLPEAHVVLGDHLRYFNWDWTGSEASYREALAFDPNSVAALRGLWALLASLGRLAEARQQLAQALTLDPLSAGLETDLGYQELFESHAKKADAAFRRALELDPAFPSANAGLWIVYDLQQRDPERLAYLLKFLDGIGYTSLTDELRKLPAGTRYVEAARLVGGRLEELSRTERVSIGAGAAILVSANELDRAEAWIVRAFDRHDPELVWLAMDPNWSALRGRPRIVDLLRKLALPVIER